MNVGAVRAVLGLTAVAGAGGAAAGLSGAVVTDERRDMATLMSGFLGVGGAAVGGLAAHAAGLTMAQEVVAGGTAAALGPQARVPIGGYLFGGVLGLAAAAGAAYGAYHLMQGAQG